MGTERLCSLTCYFRFRIRFVCCRRRNLTKSHVANASSSRSLAKKALRASIRSIRVIVPLVGILRASSRPAIGSRWQHPFSCWLSCEFSFGAFGGGEQLHLCISHRTFIVIPSARSCCFVLVFVAKFRGIFRERVCARAFISHTVDGAIPGSVACLRLRLLLRILRSGAYVFVASTPCVVCARACLCVSVCVAYRHTVFVVGHHCNCSQCGTGNAAYT